MSLEEDLITEWMDEDKYSILNDVQGSKNSFDRKNEMNFIKW